MPIFSSIARFKWLALSPFILTVAGCAAGTVGAEESIDSTQQALVSGDVAFVTVASNGTTAAATSYNNHGGTNSAVVLGTGSYRVDFPGLGGINSNFQVTSVGSAPPNPHGGSYGYCKVNHWATSGTTRQVFVDCYTTLGVLQARGFTVAAQHRSGVLPVDTAYAWANQPSSPSYTPSLALQWSSGGGNVTITREGTGIYLVSFPGQAANGHRVIEVTAKGTDAAACAPSAGNTLTEARVRCYSGSGAAVDSEFLVVFSRQSPNDVAAYTFATVAVGTNALLDSYGAIASQCGNPDSPIASPPTVTNGLLPNLTHVRFPNLSTNGLSYSVSAMSYGATSNIRCQVSAFGSEGNGTYADVGCFTATGAAAPSGTRFMVVFSTTQAIFC